MNPSHLAALPIGATVFERTFPPIRRDDLLRYATASGDDNPVHLSTLAAQAAGFDDVFAHGMLVMAFVSRGLDEALGAENILHLNARFTALTRLATPLTCTGVLQGLATDTREARVTFSVHDDREVLTLRGFAKLRADAIPRGQRD